MIARFLVHPLRAAVSSFFALVFGFTVLSCCAEESPLRIPRVNHPPKLSDFLDGTPREAEAVVTVFKQYDPHDGDPVSQPTVAYLSHDSKNLYVGWICKDDPAKIRARIAPRKQIENDDRVTINIDTFQDHKHAYWFDVNPYGIQYDGRTTDGFGDDSSWEALWYSEGRMTPDGYAVLETIPFRSLRFPHGHKQIWNICLARMIQRNNEVAIWPYVSHQRLPQFVGQFAPIEIDEDISPGRNIQLIPYGIYSNEHYLDSSNGFQQQTEHHPGLDAKAVLHDALTLDVAINPDFSEIGSDDPKVQANQRFEVTYPERRPFFLENASSLSMPEQLFFSRRIVDPQYGVRLTGSVGRWSLGALAADDRAPGLVLAQGETGHGDRAFDALVRIEREFGKQSHIGLFLSNTSFRSTWNRVGSVDLRYLFAQNWSLIGQATTTATHPQTGGHVAGPGYVLTLAESDPHSTFKSEYTDRSPGMNAKLGYLTRSDIRYWETSYSYLWKPPSSPTLQSFGPGLDVVVNYDHEQRLQNWSVAPSFSVTLPRITSLSLSRSEAFELYQGVNFRESSTSISLATSWYKWLQMSASYAQGKQPNYYPATGVTPFVANSNNASAVLTLRPQPRMRMDGIYYYTRLATDPGKLPSASLPNGDIFTNHLIRSKINYQFTRDYSFRAIFDYNSLLPNDALVASSYSKQADTTLLFSYFPHPGTTFYLGYADTFQNMDYNAEATPSYTLTSAPATSTDRQVFVKFSYLLRF
jgi:hypothetical protein